METDIDYRPDFVGRSLGTRHRRDGLDRMVELNGERILLRWRNASGMSREETEAAMGGVAPVVMMRELEFQAEQRFGPGKLRRIAAHEFVWDRLECAAEESPCSP
jgi:hypothetical protein